ncbi:acetolactate decarboxylase [Bowmanella denitrificans]|uniref:acetolactate decarboxylase n=1 Tax=Bowmanella denitrificans TaxID=366582 RepID=UPI001559BEB8|nr:acetolactate decarboxylase [Bowmanella denitrificans]
MIGSNQAYAIRIDGNFNTITLRSVPRQHPPYPAIDKVVKTQSVYTHQNIQGTLGMNFLQLTA